MKPTLIFPAGHISDVQLSQVLRGMNLDEVLVICDEEHARQAQLKISTIPHIMIDDFKDHEELLKKLEARKSRTKCEFKGVLGIDDEDQFELSRDIAKRFNLEFYNETSTGIASNKFVMKREFTRKGVPTGKFELVTDYDQEAADKIGFPNVLKLISGSGSEFIFINKDHAELKSNIAFLKKSLRKIDDDNRLRMTRFFDNETNRRKMYDPREQFLLEEFIGGEEYSYDFMVDEADGKRQVQIIRMVKKFNAKNFGYFSAYLLMNEKTAAGFGLELKRLEEVGFRISDSLRIKRGVCMVDFKLDKGEIKVIETSIRPGLGPFVHLMQRIYGYTSLGLLAKLMLGEKIDVSIPQDEGMLIGISSDKPGLIKKLEIDKLGKCKKELGLAGIHLYNKPGDIIKDMKIDHYGLELGYVLLKNPSLSKVDEIMRKVNECVAIEMAPEPKDSPS